MSAPITSEMVERITKRLFYAYEPHGTSLFAVLDGARDERIYRVVRRSPEHECLFSGSLAPSLRAASPYIVRILPGDDLIQYLIREGWGRSWGIYVAAQGGLPAARRHLRTLLRVRTDAGKKLFFRYYDPRVLREFLPLCDAQQLRQMFGPVVRFDMENPEAGALVRFRLTSNGAGPSLRHWNHSLSSTPDEKVRDE